jgi:hypothetical protein
MEVHMTRDDQRDVEAVGITVAWYCNLCHQSIPWEDERTFVRDKQAHLERHLRREENPRLTPRVRRV